MSTLITHWHIKTNPDPASPPYPHKESRHLYLTGCALTLNSIAENKEYKLTQFHEDEVTCSRCKTWLKWRTAPKPKKGKE